MGDFNTLKWKSVIHSVVEKSKDPMTPAEINHKVKTIEGRDIPFQQLKFDSLEALLKSMPDLKVERYVGQTYVQALPHKHTAPKFMQKPKIKVNKNKRQLKANYNEVVKRIRAEQDFNTNVNVKKVQSPKVSLPIGLRRRVVIKPRSPWHPEQPSSSWRSEEPRSSWRQQSNDDFCTWRLRNTDDFYPWRQPRSDCNTWRQPSNDDELEESHNDISFKSNDESNQNRVKDDDFQTSSLKILTVAEINESDTSQREINKDIESDQILVKSEPVENSAQDELDVPLTEFHDDNLIYSDLCIGLLFLFFIFVIIIGCYKVILTLSILVFLIDVLVE